MSSFDRHDRQVAEGTADISLAELARSRAASGPGDLPAFYRFVVLETVFDPSIVDDAKVDYWEHELGVRNVELARDLPRNSIIAQRITEPGASEVERPMLLFPMLPPALSMPANPGEHIWVMFESRNVRRADLGYWLWRIVGPGRVEDVNHTHMPRIFDPSFVPGTKDMHDGRTSAPHEFRPGAVNVAPDGTRTTANETATLRGEDENAYERMMLESDAGRMRTYEAVPRYRKRPGDVALEGTNNALIVLGDHRTGPSSDASTADERGPRPAVPATDLPGPARGEIDMVVGRGQAQTTLGATVENSLGFQEVDKGLTAPGSSEGDPDLSSDRSRIRLSQRGRVDVDLGLDNFNGGMSITDRADGDGAIIVKSDKVRIIARSDIELLVQGFSRDENGRMVASSDESQWAAIIIRSNGDIILRPADKGVIKLGGDDADKALVCTDQPAVVVAGQVSAPPLSTTMGGIFSNGVAGQGTFSTKILVR